MNNLKLSDEPPQLSWRSSSCDTNGLSWFQTKHINSDEARQAGLQPDGVSVHGVPVHGSRIRSPYRPH